MPPMRRGLALALTGTALLCLLAVPASAQCIERHQVTIASGSSPDGEAWSVEGTIGNNGSCREWLFGMDFNFVTTFSWGWGTGIPAGGHLSGKSWLESSDDLQENGSHRIFSGSVAGQVARVVATLSNGKRLKVKPKSVPPRLRHVVWLKNVRYFVEYYPPTGFVTSVSLFSPSGKLLRRVTSRNGEFQG